VRGFLVRDAVTVAMAALVVAAAVARRRRGAVRASTEVKIDLVVIFFLIVSLIGVVVSRVRLLLLWRCCLRSC
jgi:hypothetical protein